MSMFYVGGSIQEDTSLVVQREAVQNLRSPNAQGLRELFVLSGMAVYVEKNLRMEM